MLPRFWDALRVRLMAGAAVDWPVARAVTDGLLADGRGLERAGRPLRWRRILPALASLYRAEQRVRQEEGE